MSAPFTGQSPFPDPSQVFAGQPGEAPPGDAQGDPNAQQEPPAEQQGEPAAPEQPPIDLEGAIAHAIEAACEVATGALETSAEDFLRFSTGIEALANAMKALQPQPDPAAAARIQADQRMAGDVMRNRLETEKVGIDASRPAPAQPSPRG